MLEYLKNRLMVVLFLAITLTISNCQLPTTTTVELTALPTPVTPTRRIDPTPIPLLNEEERITLQIWTVEAVSAQAEGERSRFIKKLLNSFKRNHANIDVAEPILKKSDGKGSLLNFLRTAKEVAPSILPDVAVLDATDLKEAQSIDLLISLDSRLDRSIVQDLLPAARIMGTIDEKLLGVPLNLDVQHIIYNTQVFTKPPIYWTDIITGNAHYGFPIGNDQGLIDSATLAQYLSAGGRLLDDQEVSQIDGAALQDVLEFYKQSVDNQVIRPDSLLTSTPDSLIEDYIAGEINLIHLTASQYLTHQESLGEFTDFAHIPVQREDTIPVTLTQGWVLVLITKDPARQDAALQFMEWVLSTSNNTIWNNVNHSIPTRDASYQQLAQDSRYWQFLAEQLNTAQPYPRFSGYDDVGRIFEQTVQRVLTGETLPEEAATNAVDAVVGY